MFRIGEFSKMCKTTVKTLRYYDEVGLLKPEHTDRFTGYRFYTTRQMVALHRIQSLRQAGLTIDEISQILSGKNEKEILSRRKHEILAELAKQETQLSRIEFILTGEEYFMNYAATIKELPECIVYSKRMRVPNYNAYFELIPAIGRQVLKEYPGLQCARPEYCFITYLDNEYRKKDIHVEFCEAVTETKPDFEDIVFKKIPSVTAVSVFHKGGFDGLSDAYAFAFQWIEQNEYMMIGSPRENYIDGIWNKDNEEDWLTELQIPVVKKSEVTAQYGHTKEYSQASGKKYTAEEQTTIQKEADRIFRGFAENRNRTPDCDEAQSLVKQWQKHISNYYYDCTNEVLASLGEMYISDERFAQNLDRFGYGTAAFMSRAIKEYCRQVTRQHK